MLMAATLTLGDLKVRPDCMGTVRAANGSRKAYSSAAEQRAHIWSRTFSAHPEVVAVWTKGHATNQEVHDGVTTMWEKRGNGHADGFAKKGATDHPGWEWAKAHEILNGTKSIAKQSLRWSTEVHVALTKGLQRAAEAEGLPWPPVRRVRKRVSQDDPLQKRKARKRVLVPTQTPTNGSHVLAVDN